jgi:hypothetical protein
MGRNLLILMVAMAFSLRLSGQSSREIIDKYMEVITSYECLSASYNFSIVGKDGNIKFAIDGEFVTQGDKFIVKNDFTDIYCNGEYKAIYDKSVQEVVLIGHNKDNTNISENPFAILMNSPYAYTFGEKAESQVFSSQECWKVTLIPKSSSADHVSVDIVVSKSDYSVKSIAYVSKSGDKFCALVKCISECGKKAPSFFELDIDSLPDLEVNDLR